MAYDPSTTAVLQPSEGDTLSDFYSIAIDDPNLLDCFVNLPFSEGTPFVLNYETIADAQSRDAELLALAQNEPNKYVKQRLALDLDVYCGSRKSYCQRQYNGTIWHLAILEKTVLQTQCCCTFFTRNYENR